MREEKEILDAIHFIKENSPKLHLYVTGKLLEYTERGSFRLKAEKARKALGSIFHINKKSQLRILGELEEYKLILRINRKEYLIPITADDYVEMFES